MKFSIAQSDLLPVVQSVARSCGVRSTLPVLSNILFKAVGNEITLSATNLEIGVVKKIKAEVVDEGEITIPAKMFIDILSPLSGNKIEVEVSADQIHITTPTFNGILNGISAMEFPAIPLASERSTFLNADVLKNSLPQITFAAAADEGRPVLTGVFTELKEDVLEMVATDGFRLAHKKVHIEGEKRSPFKTLIPRRTFEEVVRLISEETSEENEVVEMSTSENQNQMVFKIGSTQLSSRLIEGQFPPWERIVPKSFENTTVINKAEILKAIKLASVFARDAANLIKIETGENKLKLSSEAKELGKQETDVDAKIEGSAITIAFNSKYLIDALSACNAQDIRMQFSGNLSPALITPLDDKTVEYVIMPIRLS